MTLFAEAPPNVTAIDVPLFVNLDPPSNTDAIIHQSLSGLKGAANKKFFIISWVPQSSKYTFRFFLKSRQAVMSDLLLIRYLIELWYFTVIRDKYMTVYRCYWSRIILVRDNPLNYPQFKNIGSKIIRSNIPI